MATLKINFLISLPSVDGGTRVIAQYAERLIAQGHDVQVYSYYKDVVPLIERLRKIRRGTTQARRKPDTRFFDDANVPVIMFDRSLSQAVSGVRDADVTIATWWQTIDWLERLPVSTGVKVHFAQGDEPCLPHVDTAAVEAAFRRPHPRITVSRWLQQKLRDSYGVSDCALVENTIDTDAFAFASRGKQSVPTIGFVYSSATIKNCFLALKCMKAMKQQFPSLVVKAFGAKAPTDEIVNEPWFHLDVKPNQDRIRDIYAGCDVWLFTSRVEGFGLPVLEALASGTPVVATPAGVAPDYVNAETGALVEGKLEAFNQAVAGILTLDETQWREMSANAASAVRHRTIDDAAREFAAALQQFIDRERNTSPVSFANRG